MRIFGVSCLIFVFICDLRADEFDYEHQSKWYDEYTQCRSDRQSPIELTTDGAEIYFDMPSITFEHYDEPYALPAKCENNGHTANIQFPKSKAYIGDIWQIYDKLAPHIHGGPLPSGRFVAESLHFHWGSRDAHGSEHVIDGQRYSMEMHILHRNTKYRTVEEARDYADGLTVLAVIYSVNSLVKTNFAGLEPVLHALESIKQFNETADISNFALTTMLGNLELDEFFNYQGSLTTPPCSQAVTWIVYPQVLPISHQQMTRFHKLSDGHGSVLENNYRSLQPKGNRKVYLRNMRKAMNSMIESPTFWDIITKMHPELYDATAIDKPSQDAKNEVPTDGSKINNSKFMASLRT